MVVEFSRTAAIIFGLLYSFVIALLLLFIVLATPESNGGVMGRGGSAGRRLLSDGLAFYHAITAGDPVSEVLGPLLPSSSSAAGDEDASSSSKASTSSSALDIAPYGSDSDDDSNGHPHGSSATDLGRREGRRAIVSVALGGDANTSSVSSSGIAVRYGGWVESPLIHALLPGGSVGRRSFRKAMALRRRFPRPHFGGALHVEHAMRIAAERGSALLEGARITPTTAAAAAEINSKASKMQYPFSASAADRQRWLERPIAGRRLRRTMVPLDDAVEFEEAYGEHSFARGGEAANAVVVDAAMARAAAAAASDPHRFLHAARQGPRRRGGIPQPRGDFEGQGVHAVADSDGEDEGAGNGDAPLRAREDLSEGEEEEGPAVGGVRAAAERRLARLLGQHGGRSAHHRLAYAASERQQTDFRSIFDQTPQERRVFHDDASFFVSLAQYRDVTCPQTIMELYQKARNPRRVFAGIVDQRRVYSEALARNEAGIRGMGPPAPSASTATALVPSSSSSFGVGFPLRDALRSPRGMIYNSSAADATCMPWYMMKTCATSDFCPTDNIRVRHDWPTNARGPTWGRYYAMLMYQGEHYFMAIDSHMRFSPHWEYQTVLNLYMVPKKSAAKAVLSHYPAGFAALNWLVAQRRTTFMMTMCYAFFMQTGIIRMHSRGFEASGWPLQQPYVAGGFIVGDAQFVHEVPFDPHLHHVFDGEEVLFAARLYTHGYDSFTPKNNILFHNYARHNAPRFWDADSPKTRELRSWGQARVKYFLQAREKRKSGDANAEANQNNKTLSLPPQPLIVPPAAAKAQGLDIEEAVYGMGTARSMEAFYAYAGVDASNWTIPFTFCREMSGNEHRPPRYHLRSERVEK